MDADDIRRRRDEVAERHGAWTAHNIHLGHGVYTMGDPSAGGNESRMRRAVQATADLTGRPFEQLRVVDLGSLEGSYAVEFASRGAAVVAVEGREANIEKVRLAKEALALERLDLVQDDVRNFSRERYGAFDVVLAVGIVYHLDVPVVFEFLANIAAACTNVAIVDTEIGAAEAATETQVHDGVAYRGFFYEEPTGAPHDRDVLWSSIGNPRSFVFSRASLHNALLQAGFTTTAECHGPPVIDARVERATFLALKGERQRFVSIPALNDLAPREVPEFTLALPGAAGTPPAPAPLPLARLRRLVPAAVKRRVRHLMDGR
ncbi:MAG: class I SAM-dependent methyltransferase [Thermoleophilaceae bacterium]